MVSAVGLIIWDVGLKAGLKTSLGIHKISLIPHFLFLLFCKHLPSVSMTEMKETAQHAG